MKVLFCLVALVSFSALACPDLQGKYDCSGKVLTITQTVDAWGFHAYEMEKGEASEVITTDDLSPESDLYSTVTCDARSLQVSTKLRDYEHTQTYSRTENGGFVMTSIENKKEGKGLKCSKK